MQTIACSCCQAHDINTPAQLGRMDQETIQNIVAEVVRLLPSDPLGMFVVKWRSPSSRPQVEHSWART